MKSSNKCMHFVYPRKALSVFQHVDCSCVTASRKHDKPFVFHITYNCLVIPDPGIGFPPMAGMHLLNWETFLEVCYSINLSRHQYHAIKKKCRATILDDLDTFSVKVSVVGWRHTHFLAGGKDNSTF